MAVARRHRGVVAVAIRIERRHAPAVDDRPQLRIAKGDGEAVQVARADAFAARFDDRFFRRPDREEGIVRIGRAFDDGYFLGGKIAPRQSVRIGELPAPLDVDSDWRFLRERDCDQLAGMAGVEFDLSTANKRLAEFFFLDEERRRIGGEVPAEESPRRHARNDRAAAVFRKSIPIGARPLRNRQKVCERIENVVRDIHVDEVDIDHSRHPNPATAIVTTCTTTTRITQAVHPPKRQNNPGSTPLTLPPA
jgi:hypothetical protein